MRVVRELTESRSKAAMQRASLAERYNDLQQEYHRMLRIADLSRTVRWAKGSAGLWGVHVGVHAASLAQLTAAVRCPLSRQRSVLIPHSPSLPPNNPAARRTWPRRAARARSCAVSSR